MFSPSLFGYFRNSFGASGLWKAGFMIETKKRADAARAEEACLAIIFFIILSSCSKGLLLKIGQEMPIQ
jgi:hypothetical protein